MVNGKYYIGVHQTDNIDDGYLGSGTLLSKAIKKYGSSCFTRNILEYFDSKEEMYKRESEVVDCLSENTYNMVPGGSGASILNNRKAFTGNHSQKTKDKISRTLTGRTLSENHKSNVSKNHWARKNPKEQAKHARSIPQTVRSLETRSKISESLKGNTNSSGRELKRVKCPHCLKEGSELAMTRWHFENCKSRCM